MLIDPSILSIALKNDKADSQIEHLAMGTLLVDPNVRRGLCNSALQVSFILNVLAHFGIHGGYHRDLLEHFEPDGGSHHGECGHFGPPIPSWGARVWSAAVGGTRSPLGGHGFGRRRSAAPDPFLVHGFCHYQGVQGHRTRVKAR